MSLKLEIDYTLTGLAQTHKLVPKQCLLSSDWPMLSELDFFACSLSLGLSDSTATLNDVQILSFVQLLLFSCDIPRTHHSTSIMSWI